MCICNTIFLISIEGEPNVVCRERVARPNVFIQFRVIDLNIVGGNIAN